MESFTCQVVLTGCVLCVDGVPYGTARHQEAHLAKTAKDTPCTFLVTAYRCLRCGHEWVPMNLHQKEQPRMCPRCKTVNWDRPRKER